MSEKEPEDRNVAIIVMEMLRALREAYDREWQRDPEPEEIEAAVNFVLF